MICHSIAYHVYFGFKQIITTLNQCGVCGTNNRIMIFHSTRVDVSATKNPSFINTALSIFSVDIMYDIHALLMAQYCTSSSHD